MNLTINISEAVNGYRVDILDYEKNKFKHENTERLIDAVGIAENYLAEIQILEYHKIKNAWTF